MSVSTEIEMRCEASVKDCERFHALGRFFFGFYIGPIRDCVLLLSNRSVWHLVVLCTYHFRLLSHAVIPSTPKHLSKFPVKTDNQVTQWAVVKKSWNVHRNFHWNFSDRRWCCKNTWNFWPEIFHEIFRGIFKNKLRLRMMRWICLFCAVRWRFHDIQGGPKKASHYQGSSLNCIKNRQCGYISHQFWV